MHVTPFAYWDGPGQQLLSPFLSEWRSAFPDFRLLGDVDIEPLLEKISPAHVPLYRRLRIPAAKADIARLVAMIEFGGLYVDCHCGLRDPVALRALFEKLDQFELLLWNKSADALQLLNSIILARAGSPMIRAILQRALENLSDHVGRVLAGEQPECRIWKMTGPWLFRSMFSEPDENGFKLRHEFAKRILIVSASDGPISLYRHTAYKADPANHWSARQQREPLFM